MTAAVNAVETQLRKHGLALVEPHRWMGSQSAVLDGDGNFPVEIPVPAAYRQFIDNPDLALQVKDMIDNIEKSKNQRMQLISASSSVLARSMTPL